MTPTTAGLAFSAADTPRHLQGMPAEPLSLDKSSADSAAARQHPEGSADSSLQLHNSGRVASTTPVEPMSIAGSWRKDKQNSDMEGYGRQLDLLGIGGMKKRAATIMMDGVSIQQDDKGFTTSFITKVRFFRPVESFSYSEPKTMPRRDQRRGSQTAVVAPISADRLEVNVTWEDPMQGGFKEVYTLPEPGVLHIHSVTTVGDRSESTLQVYRKES